MQMRLTSILKWTAVFIVAFFVVKLGVKYVADKFPNKVTSAVNTVVQTA